MAQLVNVKITSDGNPVGLMNLDLRTPPISGFNFGGASGYNIDAATGISATGVTVVGPVNFMIPANQHPGATPWILRANVSGVGTGQPNWPNVSGDVVFGHGALWGTTGVTKVAPTNDKKFFYIGADGLPATGVYNI